MLAGANCIIVRAECGTETREPTAFSCSLLVYCRSLLRIPPLLITAIDLRVSPVSRMASTSGFYRQPGSGTSQDFRRLSAVESAIHALQQQHSGASAQLSAVNTKIDLLEERIGQHIADALVERDLNQTLSASQGRVKVPREVSVSCLQDQSISVPTKHCKPSPIGLVAIPEWKSLFL